MDHSDVLWLTGFCCGAFPGVLLLAIAITSREAAAVGLGGMLTLTFTVMAFLSWHTHAPVGLKIGATAAAVAFATITTVGAWRKPRQSAIR